MLEQMYKELGISKPVLDFGKKCEDELKERFLKIDENAELNQLKEAGVRIYRYTPGFIHSKCFVSDDTTAIVGTCNLDFRSIYWNFEDFVYLYNSKTVLDVKNDALKTFEVSKEVTDAECINRHFIVRFMQSVLQLFAPLL